ncbi:MAG TPA: rubrerythrin family protein [Bacteroidota bacterium]|nr:rubrerythrin family protein [Bacteroidota bacterium]
MKNPTNLSPRFRGWYLIPCFGILALVFPQGCQKSEKPIEEKKLVSVDNLQTAYGVSLKRQHMYDLFVPRAEKEKFRGVAGLYRALSVSEGTHAKLHAALLRENNTVPEEPKYDSVVVGTTMQTLKMALSSEELEQTSMYPNILRTATTENYTKGVEQFTMIQAVEDRHVELLKDAQDRVGRIGTTYFVCPGCGYIITSDKTDECPVCKKPRAEFTKI